MHNHEVNEQKSQEEKEKDSHQEPFREIFHQVTVTPGALPQIPEYDKRIKYYLGEVNYLDDEEDQERLVKPKKKDHPKKLKDSGTLTLPCVINDVDIGRAMIDSGSSVNLMPFSDFRKIGGLGLKLANTTLTVADGSIKKPVGMVEDVIVRIEELEFLIDFLVVDMENEGRIPLILGRPFMGTFKMVIRVHDGGMRYLRISRKLKEEGVVEIRRPYSTSIRKLDRRQLGRWDDEDPNMKKKS
ncbi:uncharacterized protein LOC106758737 [Vigna radiata var. radiata]|uniref:Uncharacterized protein LOC106758737 n=1 Tax=Vigna radiata var. radiata TaxID=3916 RepID=A0A1S3TTT6_VIGRR|nr:uncharacterized protein LOC106758737 [Vigna radiata var. radiata]